MTAFKDIKSAVWTLDDMEYGLLKRNARDLEGDINRALMV